MARPKPKPRSTRSPQLAPAPEPRAVRRARWLVAAGVGLVAFVVYLLTAARDIFPGDTPEFVTVALTGGVAHAPGYPLLSILGSLLAQLPLGPGPFRVGLVSVLAHAVTVSVVFLTAERLTKDVLASAAAALLLAFGALFWSWGLVAEAFPLNDLLAALVLLFMIIWYERPAVRWPLIAAAATFGLGLANHQTITLLTPAILYVLWRRREVLRERPRIVWEAGAALVVAAVVPYLYIPLAASRDPLMSWGEVRSPLDVVRQFLRLDYGTGQLLPGSQYQGGTPPDRIAELAKVMNPALALMAIAGAARAWRRVRWYFWLSLLAFLFSGVVFAMYANADVNISTARFILVRFFLLPQVVIAPLAALGILFVVDLVRQRRRRSPPPAWFGRAVAGVVLAGAALELVLTYGAVDLRTDHVAYNFATDLLATTPQNAVLLAGGDHVILPLEYQMAVEHARPDVTLVLIPLLGLDWYDRQLTRRHPDLVIPTIRFDQPDGLKLFMQANLGKTFVLTGEQAGQSFGNVYGIYGRGLLLPVIGPNAQLDFDAVKKDNEQLLASYHVPSLAGIKKESFERFILDWYALVPYRLGKQYEDQKAYADARTWYEKALSIDPELPEAVLGIRRLPPRAP